MSKILIVTNHSYMLWQFRRELIAKLTESNEVVLSMPFVGHEDDFQEMGLRCIETEIDRRGMNPATDFKLLCTYRKMLRDERPDLVLTYSIKCNIYAGLLCGQMGIPFCANVQGLGTAFQKPGLAQFVSGLYKLSFRKVRTVFFENEENAAEFRKRHIIPIEKQKVLKGAGINLESYPYQPYPENDRVHFLYLGRLMKEKGMDELFDAVEQLRRDCEAGQGQEGMPDSRIQDRVQGNMPDSRIQDRVQGDMPDSRIQDRVQGDMPDSHPGDGVQDVTQDTEPASGDFFLDLVGFFEDEYRERVERLEAEGIAKFHGFQEDPRPWYAAADCVVLPSYHEGMSNVLLEAAATGRPLITSDIPGCREAVDDGRTGILVKAKDSESLYRAMKQVLSLSREQRAQMGQLGREKMEREFRKEAVIKETVEAMGLAGATPEKTVGDADFVTWETREVDGTSSDETPGKTKGLAGATPEKTAETVDFVTGKAGKLDGTSSDEMPGSAGLAPGKMMGLAAPISAVKSDLEGNMREITRDNLVDSTSDDNKSGNDRTIGNSGNSANTRSVGYIRNKESTTCHALTKSQKSYLPLKRAMDVALAGAFTIVSAPFMGALAVAIKLDSPGPVLFKQKRVGKDKETFEIWKFRTMRTDTPHDVPTHLLENPEAYITRTGRFLRKYSLDELPQFWQVLTGKLSIVGPRPALWNQDDLIAEREKFGANQVTPGITGWAQVNGRDELEISTKAWYDGEYVRQMSLWMDVKCFLATIGAVLSHDGVVEGGTGQMHKDSEAPENDRMHDGVGASGTEQQTHETGETPADSRTHDGVSVSGVEQQTYETGEKPADGRKLNGVGVSGTGRVDNECDTPGAGIVSSEKLAREIRTGAVAVVVAGAAVIGSLVALIKIRKRRR